MLMIGVMGVYTIFFDLCFLQGNGDLHRGARSLLAHPVILSLNGMNFLGCLMATVMAWMNPAYFQATFRFPWFVFIQVCVALDLWLAYLLVMQRQAETADTPSPSS